LNHISLHAVSKSRLGCVAESFALFNDRNASIEHPHNRIKARALGRLVCPALLHKLEIPHWGRLASFGQSRSLARGDTLRQKTSEVDRAALDLLPRNGSRPDLPHDNRKAVRNRDQ
jgi:hypothetical protein